jgi:protein TonB
LFQSLRAAAHARLARLREEGDDRRAIGIAVAVLLELVLFAVLLSLGYSKTPQKEPAPSFVSFNSESEEPPADDPPQPQTQETTEAASTAQPTATVEPVITPTEPILPPAAVLPSANPVPPPPPSPPTQSRVRAVIRDQAMGPAAPSNTGSSSDSQVVGTAPNGQPLYAAKWYREPYPEELRGFLSTATGPGWGLIACRTVADFRVEDCVGLEEQPRGSNINRAVLAAAYQFRVRPPMRGGQSLVGSWVRIRIDYTVEERRR